MDRLVLNTSHLRHLGLERSSVNCTYTYFGMGEAARVLEGEAVTLRPEGPEDAVKARCADTGTGQELASTVLLYVRPPRRPEPAGEAGTRYSVALLIIDSLSQMNFIRCLPNTLALTRAMGGVFLRGRGVRGLGMAPSKAAIIAISFNIRNQN
jgi:hypothetical protein